MSRAAKFTPSNYSASVINPVSSDTDACFVITFDQGRYVFNCSENTTRSFVQRHMGFARIKGVFFTGINSDRSGGLPGFLMSLADSGTKELDVCGPSGIAHYIASTRPYTFREALRMRLVECQPGSPSTQPVLSDDQMTVYAVPVLLSSYPKPISDPQHAAPSPPPTSTSEPSSPPSKRKRSISPPASPSKRNAIGTSIPRPNAPEPSSLQGQAAANFRTSVVETMFPGTGSPAKAASSGPPMHKRLPTFQALPLHLSYICVFPEIRGKFDVQKANALGVVGANRAKLIRGVNVIGKDGGTITPDMCIGPSRPPTALFVVDCPTTEYIEELCSSTQFQPYTAGTGSIKVLCIFHRLGDGVLESSTYKEWMHSFGPDAHHIIANDRLTPDKATFYSSSAALLRLNQLDPDIFHIPYFTLSAPETLDPTGLPPSTSVASQQKVGLRPPTAPVEQLPKDDYFHYQTKSAKLTPLERDIQKAFDQAQDRVKEIERSIGPRAPEPGDDIVVTSLGTGSAMPSKYRNVSSTLIQIPNLGNVILDCGEGTWGQLSRRFGKDPSNPDNVYRVLRDLKCIFISHIHGDHHIGVSKVLAQRRRMKLTTPIYLITSKRTILYLEEYNDLEDIGMLDHASGVRCIVTDLQGHQSEEWMAQSQASMTELCTSLGLESISLPKVNHRAPCHGIVLRHKDGWSIVFSGDTTPVDSLVAAGQGATLLIHEATMADDQEEMAALKTHSTFGQAVDVARRMGAKKLLLTHFSNRYPKIPQRHDVSSDRDHLTIAIAFDHASYRLKDMWKMEHYLPALEASFMDGTEDETFEHID